MGGGGYWFTCDEYLCVQISVLYETNPCLKGHIRVLEEASSSHPSAPVSGVCVCVCCCRTVYSMFVSVLDVDVLSGVMYSRGGALCVC